MKISSQSFHAILVQVVQNSKLLQHSNFVTVAFVGIVVFVVVAAAVLQVFFFSFVYCSFDQIKAVFAAVFGR